MIDDNAKLELPDGSQLHVYYCSGEILTGSTVNIWVPFLNTKPMRVIDDYHNNKQTVRFRFISANESFEFDGDVVNIGRANNDNKIVGELVIKVKQRYEQSKQLSSVAPL